MILIPPMITTAIVLYFCYLLYPGFSTFVPYVPICLYKVYLPYSTKTYQCTFSSVQPHRRTVPTVPPYRAHSQLHPSGAYRAWLLSFDNYWTFAGSLGADDYTTENITCVVCTQRHILSTSVQGVCASSQRWCHFQLSSPRWTKEHLSTSQRYQLSWHQGDLRPFENHTMTHRLRCGANWLFIDLDSGSKSNNWYTMTQTAFSQ